MNVIKKKLKIMEDKMKDNTINKFDYNFIKLDKLSTINKDTLIDEY